MGSSHVDLRVVRMVGGPVLHNRRVDDVSPAAVTVDVVEAVLRWRAAGVVIHDPKDA